MIICFKKVRSCWVVVLCTAFSIVGCATAPAPVVSKLSMISSNTGLSVSSNSQGRENTNPTTPHILVIDSKPFNVIRSYTSALGHQCFFVLAENAVSKLERACSFDSGLSLLKPLISSDGPTTFNGR